MHLSRDKKASVRVRALSRERVQGSNRARERRPSRTAAACRSDGHVPRPKTVFCRCASKCETSRAILQQSPLQCGVWEERERGREAAVRN